MINLLPPKAEKAWVWEQRLRTLSAFCFMAAFVSLAVLVSSLPAGELLARHGESLAKDDSLTEEVRALAEDVEKDLNTTRALMEHLSLPLEQKQYSVLIALMDDLAGDEASITHFNFDGKKELELNGVATTRVSLSAFRDRLESHEIVKTVKSPLSNLVENTRVPFSMTIIFK